MEMKHFVFLLAAVVLFSQCKPEVKKEEKLNVLFIAVDDLRTELNCYGAEHMQTPNFDRLADISTTFEQAYTQQAVCAPSRNVIMTGLRPDALGIYDLYTFFRKKVPEVVTVAQHFKNNGYYTERVGKILHLAHGNSEDSLSWSQPAVKRWSPELKIERGDTVGLEQDYPRIDGKLLPYYSSDAPEKNMSDAVTADYAVKRIGEIKDEPFFFAVGFVKPHLPFVAPKKYWDMYDPKNIKVPERKVPEGMPDVALHQFGELRKYHGIPPKGHLDDETSRNLIHGYYAAVSMIDAQLGKLLDALEENDLMDNTIIMLWGDHGWKLGEYGGWCKHTNFELDTHVPLFIYNPRDKIGQKTKSLAEFVDVYPTLCDMANLSKPTHLEGQSLAPILDNPNAVVNQVAISQYPRGKKLGYDRKNELMGYSIRHDNFRYTRWQKYEDPTDVVAVEMYDHTHSDLATVNLARDPNYHDQVEEFDHLMNTELAKYKLLRPEKQ